MKIFSSRINPKNFERTQSKAPVRVFFDKTIPNDVRQIANLVTSKLKENKCHLLILDSLRHMDNNEYLVQQCQGNINLRLLNKRMEPISDEFMIVPQKNENYLVTLSNKISKLIDNRPRQKNIVPPDKFFNDYLSIPYTIKDKDFQQTFEAINKASGAISAYAKSKYLDISFRPYIDKENRKLIMVTVKNHRKNKHKTFIGDPDRIGYMDLFRKNKKVKVIEANTSDKEILKREVSFVIPAKTQPSYIYRDKQYIARYNDTYDIMDLKKINYNNFDINDKSGRRPNFDIYEKNEYHEDNFIRHLYRLIDDAAKQLRQPKPKIHEL